MKTQYWRLDGTAADQAAIAAAAAAIKAGGVIAFPTETVYGLGGVSTRPDAIARIYAIKRRPSMSSVPSMTCPLTKASCRFARA